MAYYYAYEQVTESSYDSIRKLYCGSFESAVINMAREHVKQLETQGGQRQD